MVPRALLVYGILWGTCVRTMTGLDDLAEETLEGGTLLAASLHRQLSAHGRIGRIPQILRRDRRLIRIAGNGFRPTGTGSGRIDSIGSHAIAVLRR